MSEIVAALTGANTALQLLKAAIRARDDAKIRTAISDISDRLSSAQLAVLSGNEKLLEFQQRIAALEREKAELVTKLANIANYVPVNIYRGDGTFIAYRENTGSSPGDDIGQSPRYLCQSCFDKGNKSYLRIEGLTAYCPTCKEKVTLDPESAGRHAFTITTI